MHGTGYGTAQTIRRRRADAADVRGALLVAAELQRAARQSEDRIAVERCMCRAHRARDPILRHHRDALAFRRRQIGVARDHAERGVGSGLQPTDRQKPGFLGCGIAQVHELLGRAPATEFLVQLERPRPIGLAVGHQRRSDGVQRDQCTDDETLTQIQRGRADSALDQTGHCAAARTDCTQGEITLGGIERTNPQVAIRRCKPPVLVAAIAKIVQNGRGNDRNPRRSGTQFQSNPLGRQSRRNTVRRGQPKHRASREYHGVRAPDQILGGQRVGFAPAGAAAAHVHGGRPRRAAEQRRHSGAHPFVGRVAHLEPRDIRNQVSVGGPKQGIAWAVRAAAPR